MSSRPPLPSDCTSAVSAELPSSLLQTAEFEFIYSMEPNNQRCRLRDPAPWQFAGRGGVVDASYRKLYVLSSVTTAIINRK